MYFQAILQFCCLAFFLKSTSAARIDAKCSASDTTVAFDLEFKPITATLSRHLTASDEFCTGILDLNSRTQVGDRNVVIQLASNVFQNLPALTEIDIGNNRLDASSADLYIGSEKLTTIAADRSFFSKLDSSVVFPPSITALDLNNNILLQKITLGFFNAHPNLIEINLNSLQLYFPEIEASTFKNAKLERLHISTSRATFMPKDMFSDIKNLKFLDLSSWDQLTAIESKALSGISTDELLLGGWPFRTIAEELFFDSSIKTLDLSNSNLKYLGPRGFASLKDTTRLHLGRNDISAIQSKAFEDFAPGPSFNLVLDGVECCNAQGLFELTSTNGDIRVNGNNQNYTCKEPNGDFKEILFQNDPSLDLTCCFEELLYYEQSTGQCEACTADPFCITYDSNVCNGKRLECSECNNAHFLVKDDDKGETTCEACVIESNCQTPGTTCVTKTDVTNYLKCDVCKEGFKLNTGSGLCEECLESSNQCQIYGSACVIGIEQSQLQCEVCIEGDIILLPNGQCATVKGSKLATPIIIAIACSAVVILAIFLFGGVFIALRRRKQRKTKKLNELFGIGEEEGIELQTDEEFEASQANNFLNEMSYINSVTHSADQLIDNDYEGIGEADYDGLHADYIKTDESEATRFAEPNEYSTTGQGPTEELHYASIQPVMLAGNDIEDEDYITTGVQGAQPVSKDAEYVVAGAQPSFEDDEYVVAGVQPSYNDDDDNDEYVVAGVQPSCGDDDEYVVAGVQPSYEDDDEYVVAGVQPSYENDDEYVVAGVQPSYACHEEDEYVVAGIQPRQSFDEDDEYVVAGVQPGEEGLAGLQLSQFSDEDNENVVAGVQFSKDPDENDEYDIYSAPQQKSATAEDIYSAPQKNSFTAEEIYSAPQQKPTEDLYSAPQQNSTDDIYSVPQQKSTTAKDIYSVPQQKATEDLYSVPQRNSTDDIYSAPQLKSTEDLFRAPKRKSIEDIYCAPQQKSTEDEYSTSQQVDEDQYSAPQQRFNDTAQHPKSTEDIYCSPQKDFADGKPEEVYSSPQKTRERSSTQSEDEYSSPQEYSQGLIKVDDIYDVADHK